MCWEALARAGDTSPQEVAQRAARPGAGPSTVRSRADKHVGLGGGEDPWRCWVSGLQGMTAQKENKSGFLG